MRKSSDWENARMRPSRISRCSDSISCVKFLQVGFMCSKPMRSVTSGISNHNNWRITAIRLPNSSMEYARPPTFSPRTRSCTPAKGEAESRHGREREPPEVEQATGESVAVEAGVAGAKTSEERRHPGPRDQTGQIGRAHV